jgi:pyrroloquinoline-quinone synthase
MSHLSQHRAPSVTARAGEALQQIRIMDNPYFARLCDGTMSPEQFRTTQQQFFFAVTFFSRPMAALVGRIDDPHARIEILRNLVEEHGEFEERAYHHNTFRRFLQTLGCGPDELANATVTPPIRAFNSVLIAACVLDEVEVGIACMGVIEHAFAGISALIGRAVVDRGWVPADQLVHYRVHAEVDERHAEEFFAVIEPRWGDPARRYYIEQGLDLGAYIFDRLYFDLAAMTVRRA